MLADSNWVFFFCYFRDVTRTLGCNTRNCWQQREERCGYDTASCGYYWWSSLWCTIKNWVCRAFYTTVCSGCAVWNTVVETVCKVIKNGLCLIQGLLSCVSLGLCYVSKAVSTIQSCTTGLIMPSQECLKEGKYIEWTMKTNLWFQKIFCYRY